MSDYPSPAGNPKCVCWPNLMAAMFCPYGHMTECHYPMTCTEAECSHYQAEMDLEEDSLNDLEEGDEHKE